MKKNFFFLLLLAIIAVSCQKDIEPSSVASVKTNEVTPTYALQKSLFDEQAKPQANDDVYTKINAFKEKIANIEAGTIPESDNSTTIEDAIWNIEALMNSGYARANRPFKKLTTAKNTIQVALNDDGTIDNAALLAALNQTKRQLSSQYHAISDSVKHVIAIDIRKKEPQVESNESILLEVEGIYGLGDALPLPFGSNDYWHWGLGLGTCAGPPTQQPSDAATILGGVLNYRGRWRRDVFFTDEEIRYLWTTDMSNPSDATPNDNIRDYLIFKQDPNLPNYNVYECLPPIEMNFYFDGAQSVMNSMRPLGKSFISTDMYWNATNQPVPPIFHSGSINYGIIHLTNDPIDIF